MADVPRIAAFLSHYAGHAVLEALLAMADFLRVVLVATDDPEKPYCRPQERLWRYGWDEELRRLVPRLAAAAGLPTFTGSVRNAGGLFHRRFVAARPDAIVTAVFGQKLPEHLLDQVRRRAWNVHPVLPGRPLCETAGRKPFELAYRRQSRRMQLCLHWMTGVIDEGDEAARSAPFPLPPASALTSGLMLEIQRRSAPPSAELVRRALPPLLRDSSSQGTSVRQEGCVHDG